MIARRSSLERKMDMLQARTGIFDWRARYVRCRLINSVVGLKISFSPC